MKSKTNNLFENYKTALNEEWSPNNSLEIVELNDYDNLGEIYYGKFNDGNYFIATDDAIGIFNADPKVVYGFTDETNYSFYDYDNREAMDKQLKFDNEHELASYELNEPNYDTLMELIKDRKEAKTLGNIKNLVDLEKTNESTEIVNEEEKSIYDYTEEDIEAMNLDEMIKLYSKICIEADMDVVNLLRFLNNSGCLNTGSFRNMLEETIEYMHYGDND